MKFFENAEQAANVVRQAIPTMVKHKIVPNPLNYTLWYTYYSNAFPDLNKELEQTIERFGTCPPNVSESLFVRHISSLKASDEQKLADFHQAFSNVVTSLSNSLDYTSQRTNEYSSALKDNIQSLEASEFAAHMAPVLDELNANASAIVDANDEFHEQLVSANAQINALKEALKESQRAANTDELTGLYNRRVMEAIYREFSQQGSNSEDFTLILLDIDKFKSFNDTFGHMLGDQVLKLVAELLKKECLANSTPVRFGGEEFAIVCPDFTLEQANQMAEHIRKTLAQMPYYNRKTNTRIPPVTASFGIACKQTDEDLVGLIERADQALYQAKHGGRNQVKLAA